MPSPPAQYYFTSVQNIAGSTSSGSFTAQGVSNQGTISNCVFSLVGLSL